MLHWIGPWLEILESNSVGEAGPCCRIIRRSGRQRESSRYCTLVATSFRFHIEAILTSPCIFNTNEKLMRQIIIQTQRELYKILQTSMP
jgi:hypothetical protein